MRNGRIEVSTAMVTGASRALGRRRPNWPHRIVRVRGRRTGLDLRPRIGSVREPVTAIHTKPIGRRLADAVDTHVSLVGRRDLSGEIYRQLRTAILEGRLLHGDRLPPTRELAQRLRVSR